MNLSYFEKLYFKKRTRDSLKRFKKQKSHCINHTSRLYKKEWRKYFESLDPSRIIDKSSFGKKMQPFFSEK